MFVSRKRKNDNTQLSSSSHQYYNGENFNVKRARDLIKNDGDSLNDMDKDFQQHDKNMHEVRLAILDMQTENKDASMKVQQLDEIVRAKQIELDDLENKRANVEATLQIAMDADKELQTRIDDQHAAMSDMTKMVEDVRNQLNNERKKHVENVGKDNDKMHELLMNDVEKNQISNDNSTDEVATIENNLRNKLLSNSDFETLIVKLRDAQNNIQQDKKCTLCGLKEHLMIATPLDLISALENLQQIMTQILKKNEE